MTDDWLPAGQIATRKFPVVGERVAPSVTLADWRLEVSGAVARPMTLTLEDLWGRPQQTRTDDIHCVTGWSTRARSFTGVPLAALLDEAKPNPVARFVRFVAHSPRDHDTTLPLPLALADTWLVHAMDGAPLSPEHGAPLRAITPSRWFYKSVKWLRRVELLETERLGFWERTSGYDNVADPRGQRYVHGEVRSEWVRALREGARLDRFRGKVILGVDLRGWSPASRDLRGLQLKDCDLTGAQLAGADLTGANLTRSRFDGADLTGAILIDADLEGADFSGATLIDADLSGSALSATAFVSPDTDGHRRGATVRGLRYERVTGLLESQEAYLLENA